MYMVYTYIRMVHDCIGVRKMEFEGISAIQFLTQYYTTKMMMPVES